MAHNRLVVADVCEDTGFTAADIVSTFLDLGILRYQSGKHVLLRDDAMLDEYLRSQERYDLKVCIGPGRTLCFVLFWRRHVKST